MSTPIQQLAWRSYGDAHLPPLVLLMGLGMPAMAWPESFVSALVQAGFCVYTPENRDVVAAASKERVYLGRLLWAGFRYLMHRPVKAPYRLEDMASDVERFMDTVGIERAHVVGISMGGMIAQTLACQAPNRVNTLTCISSSSGNPTKMVKHYSSLWTLMNINWKTTDGKEQQSNLKALGKALGTKPEAGRLEQACQVMQWKAEHGNPDGTARQLLAIMASGDRRPRLRQLHVPALVLHGTADPLLDINGGEEIAECIAGGRFIPIEGMGHEIPESEVGRIAKAIAAHCYRGPLR